MVAQKGVGHVEASFTLKPLRLVWLRTSAGHLPGYDYPTTWEELGMYCGKSVRVAIAPSLLASRRWKCASFTDLLRLD